MERLAPLARISAGLVFLTGALLAVLDLVGIVPMPHRDAELDARLALCEKLATKVATAVDTSDFASLRSHLELAVRRNEAVQSVGLRTREGRLLVASGEHAALWSPDRDVGSTPTHVRLPLFRREGHWADLEVRFARSASGGWLQALWARPLVRLLALLSAPAFVLYLLYMRRTLRHLDPSAVIPTRVQAALDVMAEGVLLLDSEERIVLVNAVLAERLGRSPASLLGVKASKLQWQDPRGPVTSNRFPWREAIDECRTSTGNAMRIQAASGEERVFFVNCAPLLDGWGRAKGAIATFDDVTELEEKRTKLEETMSMLEKSQEEVRLQNEELQLLARRDPLTGISNRRAFLESFEGEFAAATKLGRELSCIMADIDHFKRINDAHGHAAGDEVIRRIADAMVSEVRSADCVCRYGGEEFCVLLPGAPVTVAMRVAERLRRTAQLPGFARVPVTVSFGVSSLSFGAQKMNDLINQADEALYAAKRAGRDRVTCWSEVLASDE